MVLVCVCLCTRSRRIWRCDYSLQLGKEAEEAVREGGKHHPQIVDTELQNKISLELSCECFLSETNWTVVDGHTAFRVPGEGGEEVLVPSCCASWCTCTRSSWLRGSKVKAHPPTDYYEYNTVHTHHQSWLALRLMWGYFSCWHSNNKKTKKTKQDTTT